MSEVKPLDSKKLRSAFGSFMTGVTVVTAVGRDGVPVGFTANSYTSVSLDPPLLLVCPAKSLSSFDIFNTCDHFAINVLSEDQQDVSNIFASSKEGRFNQVEWVADGHNCPVLKDVSASFSCSVHERVDAGDHIILIGEIKAYEHEDKAGLGYCSDGYFNLNMERRAQELYSGDGAITTGAIIECDGSIIVQETEDGVTLPHISTPSMNGSLAALKGLMADNGVRTRFGPMYSIFNGSDGREVNTYYRVKAFSDSAGDLGRYVSLKDIESLSFKSAAVKTMLSRYAEEYQGDAFGLYLGDAQMGEVHKLDEGV